MISMIGWIMGPDWDNWVNCIYLNINGKPIERNISQ
jgi:hypothetical protein